MSTIDGYKILRESSGNILAWDINEVGQPYFIVFNREGKRIATTFVQGRTALEIAVNAISLFEMSVLLDMNLMK